MVWCRRSNGRSSDNGSGSRFLFKDQIGKSPLVRGGLQVWSQSMSFIQKATKNALSCFGEWFLYQQNQSIVCQTQVQRWHSDVVNHRNRAECEFCACFWKKHRNKELLVLPLLWLLVLGLLVGFYPLSLSTLILLLESDLPLLLLSWLRLLRFSPFSALACNLFSLLLPICVFV